MTLRKLVAVCTIAVLGLVVGCGGHSSTQTTSALPATHPALPSGLALPAPSTLRSAAFTEATINLNGAAFGTPPQFSSSNLTTSGTKGVFAPNYDPANPSDPTGLAYGCYAFTADGYDRDPTVRFSWATAHDVSNLYIAVSDFTTNRWDLYPGPSGGVLTLTADQMTSAIDPTTHLMVVVPIIMGTDPWTLNAVRLGAVPMPDIASVSPLTGHVGDVVSMSVTPSAISGPIAQYQWSFAGGATPNSSAQATPQITLGAVGQYDCTVRGTNPAGQQTFHFQLTVTPGVVAPNITAVTPMRGAPSDTITLTPTNSGDPVDTWSWDFGGGATPNTSTDPAPQIQLSATEAVYAASVTATNIAGSSTYNFNLTVQTPPPAPAVIHVLPPSGTTGHVTAFSAFTNGEPIDTWAWDFGGGAVPNTASDSGPLVTLAGPGTYSASVTVSNAGGQSTYDFQLFVTPAMGGIPIINSVAPSSGNPGDMVTFIANYDGQADSWSWDFAGAATPNTSTAANPVVTLTGAPGPYNCTVTASNITDGAGPPHIFQFTINGAALQPPNITDVQPQTGSSGAVVSFVATNTGGPVASWSWDFGGGATPGTSTDPSPSETLGAAGPMPYSCTVTAHNAAGDSVFPFSLTITP